MSWWTTTLESVSKFTASLSGKNVLIGTDLQTFNAAMTSTVKTMLDLKAGALTPEETLATIDLQLKAIAIVYPPAASIESYVEAGEILLTVLDQLGIKIKIDHGKPYRGDGINPNAGDGTDTPLGV